jgi:chromosome partitioning protein
MIITVGGIKGGSGKTTIAVNLAIMRSLSGADVLLIDADDQGTSSDFTAVRDEQKGGSGYTLARLSGRLITSEVEKFSTRFGDIIIDVGGRDTASQRAAMVVSDIFLVPFLPRSFDIWTLNSVSELLNEVSSFSDLRAFAFLNRADPSGTDNSEAAELIRESAKQSPLQYLNIAIGNRKAFASAAALGESVVESRSPDTKAITEMDALYEAVFSLANASKKSKGKKK